MAKKKTQRRSKTTAETVAMPAKRDTMKLLRNGGIAAVILGAGGFVSVRAVRATVAEQDLTTIGQGRPTIVQIHDPTCALCTELQRQARSALRAIDSKLLDYRVANIRTDEGASFANGVGAAHVTLVLFDGEGALVQRLEGVRQADELQREFEALLN